MNRFIKIGSQICWTAAWKWELIDHSWSFQSTQGGGSWHNNWQQAHCRDPVHQGRWWLFRNKPCWDPWNSTCKPLLLVDPNWTSIGQLPSSMPHPLGWGIFSMDGLSAKQVHWLLVPLASTGGTVKMQMQQRVVIKRRQKVLVLLFFVFKNTVNCTKPHSSTLQVSCVFLNGHCVFLEGIVVCLWSCWLQQWCWRACFFLFDLKDGDYVWPSDIMVLGPGLCASIRKLAESHL